MASISMISGVQNSALVGQVPEKTRPATDQQAADDSHATSVLPEPSGLKGIKENTENTPQQRITATLEETEEVASRIQERIDELAPNHHLVSIITDEKTQTSIIQIKDHRGEVIKQYPPEKVLNLHQKLDDLSGMVIDEMT